MKTAIIFYRLGISTLAIIAGTWAFMPASAQTLTADHMLVLRKGPNPSYPVLTIVPPGMKFQMNGCPSRWCEISSQGQTGYISLKNLFPEPPAAWANGFPMPYGGGGSNHSRPPDTAVQDVSPQWNRHWDLPGNNLRKQGNSYFQNR